MDSMQSMKRDLAVGSCISVFALAFALAWGSPFTGAAYAQDQAPQTQQQNRQQNQNRTASFTGTIVRQGNVYGLRDSSGAIYRLDSADQAEQYEGKAVKVIGQLDVRTMTIHVESIEAAQG
jgi:Protein of unknown function (DUF5818)